MKRTLLPALALIATGCSDPIPRNLDGLVRQGEVYLDQETMRPYSGPVFQLFSNDTRIIQRAFTLQDGKRGEYGTDETYYENGQLRFKGTYVAGEQDGPVESYHENGNLQFKGTYVAGERDGLHEGYYENGQLDEKLTYVAGQLHGLREFYLENGQLFGGGAPTTWVRNAVSGSTASVRM